VVDASPVSQTVMRKKGSQAVSTPALKEIFTQQSPKSKRSGADPSSAVPSPSLGGLSPTLTPSKKWVTASTKWTEKGEEKEYCTAPILCVSGGGGAFLHGTNIEPSNMSVHNVPYKRVCAYPPETVSKILAGENVLHFRGRNSAFDVIGGIFYFLLCYSLFPLCGTDANDAYLKLVASDTPLSLLTNFMAIIFKLQTLIFEKSYVSLVSYIVANIVLIGFTEGKLSLSRRVVTGMIHGYTHWILSLVCFLLLELGLGFLTNHGFLGVQSLDYLSVQLKDFPALAVPIYWLDYVSLGLFSQGIYIGNLVFDAPHTMAFIRREICEVGFAATSRGHEILYLLTTFVYYWTIAAPTAALVMGTYLWLNTCFLNCHYNEAFSSLRIEDYKNFMRLHITSKGDLEVFAIGIQSVAKKWVRDPSWQGGGRQSDKVAGLPSWKWIYPSRWIPEKEKEVNKPFLIDSFVIRKGSDAPHYKKRSF
jgi:hypothetical protein